MEKEELKASIINFGNNFSFNVSSILFFSIFINLDKETLVLFFGLIVNIIVAKIFNSLSSGSYIQKFFCKLEAGKKINGLDSIQLFGFLTGYYTLNKYIKYSSAKWASSFVFLIVASICFCRIYIEEQFSIQGLVSMWFAGFLIGAFTGFLSGNAADENSKKNLKDHNSNNSEEDYNDKTCTKNDQDDYICQAFKDGKVFENTS